MKHRVVVVIVVAVLVVNACICSTVGSTYMHVGYKHTPPICTTCI